MTTTINASPTNGLVQTADGSGVLKVQSNGVTTNALAWVNFNGLSGASPVIRSSYNISSVTRTGTGLYTVAFTTTLSDANYAAQVTSSLNYGSYSTCGAIAVSTGIPTTTNLYVTTFQTSSTNYIDSQYVCVSVFGN